MAEATIFTNGNACSDALRVVVHGGDGGIGAVAFGLGRQAEHQDAGDQASKPDDAAGSTKGAARWDPEPSVAPSPAGAGGV